MRKYPISSEFKAFSHLVPPINRPFLKLAQKHMPVPKFLWQDPELDVQMQLIPGYQGDSIEVYILTPKKLTAPLPCLINYHGGGFVLEGAHYHYRLAMTYAKQAHCKVIFVRYRLAPNHPFPVPIEDGYAAMNWVYENADALGIDRERIAVGGDSAGGQLSASVCLLARTRNHPIRPLFQLLIYPFLDVRNNSESAQRYTDTPMWNSKLTEKVSPIVNPGNAVTDKRITSPVEVEDLTGMPDAYIETAEFDCLHDDGILYAKRLTEAGVAVELNETKGTIHGYDIVLDCPTTKDAVAKRLAFMKQRFASKQLP